MKSFFIILSCILILSSGYVNAKEHGSKPKSNAAFFDILNSGLQINGKINSETVPQFKCPIGDIYSFIVGYRVSPSNHVEAEYGPNLKFKYIELYYSNHYLNFRIGYAPGQWYEKLYSMSFNVTYPNNEIPESETPVFKKIKQLYGDWKKREKFRINSGGINEDLNYYVWVSNDTVITYRSYKDKKRGTVVVVEFWDGGFYNSHPYYDYD